MDAFVIQGGQRLRGRVRIHGSKNASLPLMAAALLSAAPAVVAESAQPLANSSAALAALQSSAATQDVKKEQRACKPRASARHREGQSFRCRNNDPSKR